MIITRAFDIKEGSVGDLLTAAIVVNETTMKAVIGCLVDKSTWFAVDPLPDNDYIVHVKLGDDVKLYQSLLDPAWPVVGLHSSEFDRCVPDDVVHRPDYPEMSRHIREALCESVLWQTVRDVVLESLKSA